MKRILIGERPNWKEQAEAVGFKFHTMYGEPYWDEQSVYEFTLDQVENDIEDPSTELHAMCREAVAKIVTSEDLMTRLGIPQHHWDFVAQSWADQEPELYGRFDLVYDGTGPAKMLEYNADTPTSLFEAAFLAAQAEHERVAPRYDEKALCEEEHEGQCYVQESSGGGSFFMPFMAGYLMSNALSSNQGVAAQPLYKNRSGFSTASGTRFSSNAGAYNVSPRSFSAAPAAAAPMSRATVRSTGGFGSARTGGSFGG